MRERPPQYRPAHATVAPGGNANVAVLRLSTVGSGVSLTYTMS